MEVGGTDFFHALLEAATNFIGGITGGLDVTKVTTILLALIPATYGVYVKWRNSGYRMLDRLHEFVNKEEKRVDGSREMLAALVRCPSPDRPLDKPAFSSRDLGRALRKMNWGFGSAATNDLSGAVRISSEQARLSQDNGAAHKRRQALAHLLLGARAASKETTDPNEKNAARAAALSEFDKALEINPDDADALEFAGMMLLELANPAGALARFNNLIALRQAVGGINLARVYRLQATAFENLPLPQNGNANNALNNALLHLPAQPVIERARTHEQQGQVRVKLTFLGAANNSFQAALTIYQSIRTTPEGKAGLERVNAAIASLNRAQGATGAIDGAGSASPAAPPPGFFEKWSKLAKPNG